MKRIYTILAAVLLTATVWAQTPEKMSYQAVIRNSSDALITNTQVGVRISILQGSTSGTAVYTETQTPTTNANGLVSIEIGAGTIVTGDFATIDWSADTYFIKTETDPAGGTSYTITATSQLLSVPYALYAKEAGNMPDVSGIATNTTAIATNTQAIQDTADNIRAETDISNLATKTALGDSTALVRSEIPDVSGFISTETDGDPTNEIQMLSVSLTGDTLYLSASNWVIIPGIGAANNPPPTTVTDIDGNTYQIVTIGTQVWMAENLKVTQYADGTPIPLVTDETAWAVLGDNDTDKGYCWYNDDISNKDTYGALYTYAAATNGTPYSTVDVQGVCPDGWHLPSDAEWTTLETFISNDGHLGTEGTALKATAGWNSGGTTGTDNYEFAALPGGYRDYSSGTFYGAGNDGYWWSSTQYDSSNAYARGLAHYRSGVDRNNGSKSFGFSVRCLRD